MRRFFLTFSLFAALLTGGLSASAVACPMCSQANESAQGEEENARPRAYMYSILFMMAMPATILAGFGIGFYRLSKKNGDPADAADANSPAEQSGE